MPPKGKDRTRPVNEQILVEAARIYDNRELRDEEDDVKMMKGTDLMSFSKFLSKQDAFTKVSLVAPQTAPLQRGPPLVLLHSLWLSSCVTLDRWLRTQPDMCVRSHRSGCAQQLPQDLLERAKNMRPPRDRITCLLIGNHSAGKSSFTNWLVDSGA